MSATSPDRPTPRAQPGAGSPSARHAAAQPRPGAPPSAGPRAASGAQQAAEHPPAPPDQTPFEHHYGHGRMPLFMKLVWLAFLVFGAWYVTSFLLASLADELG